MMMFFKVKCTVIAHRSSAHHVWPNTELGTLKTRELLPATFASPTSPEMFPRTTYDERANAAAETQQRAASASILRLLSSPLLSPPSFWGDIWGKGSIWPIPSTPGSREDEDRERERERHTRTRRLGGSRVLVQTLRGLAWCAGRAGRAENVHNMMWRWKSLVSNWGKLGVQQSWGHAPMPSRAASLSHVS